MSDRSGDESNVLERELMSLLHQIEDWLEKPMIALAFVWLALTIAELIWGLGPAVGLIVSGIWVVFILDFLL
ncbi:MAG: potassium channel protein, partial [Rhodothermales bacterium]